jgi:hypothetical protein
MYLNVLINKNAVSWTKSICLDQGSIQNYFTQGKIFINGLAKRIESSQFRKDYEQFYSYPDASKEQTDRMLEEFIRYQNK